MKYTSLKNDIVNILHSSDFNLDLKFYDKDGNTTIDVEEATWGYINNENMMIEFMTEENPVIYLWKDKKNVDNKMKNIIQRIRELAILNGVSVQIRVYDNLDQRKIYNLIKSSIITNTKDEEEMNESLNNIENPLLEAFKSIVSVAKNTKKSSDFYMSEAIQSKNSENIFKEIISEIKNIQNLKNLNLSESLNKLMTVSSLSDIENIIKNIPLKTLNKLSESAYDIKNISNFVKQKYLNNVPFYEDKKTNILVLENVKVYKATIKNNRENLINAYNKLVSVSENVKSGIDLLKEIKHHKILETYNVSKKDLLDLWLSKNHTPIKTQSVYIIENYIGEKVAFSDKLSYGIRALAQYINNGGNKDTQICKNIVLETIKYNQISSFIIEYKDNFSVRKYIPKFKNIFKETVEKLKSANSDFNSILFESCEDNIDYSEQLKKLISESGIEHPALKYIAIEEAKKEFYSYKLLNETKDNDIKILSKELRHYSPISSVISNCIIENNLNIKPLTESVNKNNIVEVASNLYENLSNDLNKITTPVSSALFNIIHSNKKLIETKIDFMNTLIKYCK